MNRQVFVKMRECVKSGSSVASSNYGHTSASVHRPGIAAGAGALRSRQREPCTAGDARAERRPDGDPCRRYFEPWRCAGPLRDGVGADGCQPGTVVEDRPRRGSDRASCRRSESGSESSFYGNGVAWRKARAQHARTGTQKHPREGVPLASVVV